MKQNQMKFLSEMKDKFLADQSEVAAKLEDIERVYGSGRCSGWLYLAIDNRYVEEMGDETFHLALSYQVNEKSEPCGSGKDGVEGGDEKTVLEFSHYDEDCGPTEYVYSGEIIATPRVKGKMSFGLHVAGVSSGCFRFANMVIDVFPAREFSTLSEVRGAAQNIFGSFDNEEYARYLASSLEEAKRVQVRYAEPISIVGRTIS